MIVTAMRVDLAIPGARSLKDKRAVIRSMADKIRHDFRASVAEVGDNELWGNASLGVAIVGTDAAFGESIMQKIVDMIASNPEAEVVGVLIDELRS